MIFVHGNSSSFFSIDRWLVPPKPKQPPASAWGKFKSLRPYQLTLPYMRNNYVYLIFLAVYVLVNVLLFGFRIYTYRNSNMYTILARACGKYDMYINLFVTLVTSNLSLIWFKMHVMYKIIIMSNKITYSISLYLY
jgi:hypothetical protein